ncbi:MAG: hemin ABC transporter substrate-binding protein, partial [Pseudomonadota bacterium]
MKTLLIKLPTLITACLALGLGVSAQDRIVSVGGDVTEIIYALGEGDRIAATDSTSVFPLRALATPSADRFRTYPTFGVAN